MFRSPFNIVFLGGGVSILSEPGLEGSNLKLNIQGAFFLTFLSKIVETKIVRERLQAVLVLEVVFSAFYVSDDTEFEFIENKIMGFRMTGRQI